MQHVIVNGLEVAIDVSTEGRDQIIKERGEKGGILSSRGRKKTQLLAGGCLAEVIDFGTVQVSGWEHKEDQEGEKKQEEEQFLAEKGSNDDALPNIEVMPTIEDKDELMSNEELFFSLSQVLRKFPKETDKVLCHFCFKPKKVTEEALRPTIKTRKVQMLISDIIVLKTALDALPFLSKVLKDAKSLLLCNIYKTVGENKKYGAMRKRLCAFAFGEGKLAMAEDLRIGDVIDEDVIHARAPFIACTQQCFAIKAGIDGFLDVARRSFCDTSEAVHNLTNKYRDEFKLPNLKIPYNNRQGFYFSIPQKDVSGKLPDRFIQVMKHGKNIHCSSFELASVSTLLLFSSIFNPLPLQPRHRGFYEEEMQKGYLAGAKSLKQGNPRLSRLFLESRDVRTHCHAGVEPPLRSSPPQPDMPPRDASSPTSTKPLGQGKSRAFSSSCRSPLLSRLCPCAVNLDAEVHNWLVTANDVTSDSNDSRLPSLFT
ncbi:hypothetical protein ZIOFF_063570 [Zingiber officinale]|uniref:DNA mismatch repair protein MutS clamp domain-containing protein n=1 Tax=Zingiber officinale TaxID=94328 RepID=A0A8J5F6K4_ZINOF|nr:hypothetical protein ZIOFF_063570 [Zingiber officinale]